MDTLEQRLTADLTDAAEAAMTAGLTPPDLAAVVAGAATRRRKRRLTVSAAVAAAVLAVAGLVAALAAGPDHDRTEMYPATTGTERPTTTQGSPPTTKPGDTTSTTADGTTPTTRGGTGTDPDTTATTPNDPEVPGNGPNPVPIDKDTMRTIAYPLNQGVDQLPKPCRDYWQTSGYTPEGNGLSGDQSGILIDEGTITLADINGDGVQDGLATYICETGGVFPPGGIMALIAEPGEAGSFGTYFDDGSITAQHEQQFGDPRTRFTGPFQLVGDPGGMRDITVELNSYRQSDANAGSSAQAIATYRVVGQTLELVDLRQL